MEGIDETGELPPTAEPSLSSGLQDRIRRADPLAQPKLDILSEDSIHLILNMPDPETPPPVAEETGEPGVAEEAFPEPEVAEEVLPEAGVAEEGLPGEGVVAEVPPEAEVAANVLPKPRVEEEVLPEAEVAAKVLLEPGVAEEVALPKVEVVTDVLPEVGVTVDGSPGQGDEPPGDEAAAEGGGAVPGEPTCQPAEEPLQGTTDIEVDGPDPGFVMIPETPIMVPEEIVLVEEDVLSCGTEPLEEEPEVVASRRDQELKEGAGIGGTSSTQEERGEPEVTSNLAQGDQGSEDRGAAKRAAATLVELEGQPPAKRARARSV